MTRLLELARQAWRRVELLGHDPVEAIHAAMVQAVDERARPASAYDGLPEAQREVAVAMLGAGEVRVRDLARILDLAAATVEHRLHRLKRAGLVRRLGYGRYCLTQHAPPGWQLRTGRLWRRAALDLAVRLPAVRPADLVRVRGISTQSACDQLRALVREGKLVKVGHGRYARPGRGSASRHPSAA